MTRATDQGNWFQQLIARLTGRNRSAEVTSPSRYTPATQQTDAQRDQARSDLRDSMMAFREEHTRTQGGPDKPDTTG